MKVEQNIARLKNLMKMYKISSKELVSEISEGLKKPITIEDVMDSQIELSHLKRIDKFFNKGLHYYLDPKAPESSKEASIFFRKDNFNSELNIGAKKIVNKFEEFKISLSAIAKLADIEFTRTFPVYTINHKPSNVARDVRELLYPDFDPDLKTFLKSLITKFAENTILVFEFVEYWNQKEKANIDGFFISPNVLVLKRQQTSFRREIFTLIHELAHYLLNEEEIEEVDYFKEKDSSAIEKWCHSFAFHFLIGDHLREFDSIKSANTENDYQFDLIEGISKVTHLSELAIFTNLLLQNKLSRESYDRIREDFDERHRLKQVELRKQKEIDKELGIKRRGSAPQPIKSPLLVSTIQTAFYEGVLNEYEVCQKLNIKPDKLGDFIP